MLEFPDVNKFVIQVVEENWMSSKAESVENDSFGGTPGYGVEHLHAAEFGSPKIDALIMVV